MDWSTPLFSDGGRLGKSVDGDLIVLASRNSRPPVGKVPFLPVVCKVTWSYPWCAQFASDKKLSCHGSQGMDLSDLQHQILSSNQTANEKADKFLLKKKVHDLSTDQWQKLVAGIPEDVEECIGALKSAGTQRYCHICLLVHHILL